LKTILYTESDSHDIHENDEWGEYESFDTHIDDGVYVIDLKQLHLNSIAILKICIQSLKVVIQTPRRGALSDHCRGSSAILSSDRDDVFTYGVMLYHAMIRRSQCKGEAAEVG
jgi:hypothetical protein